MALNRIRTASVLVSILLASASMTTASASPNMSLVGEDAVVAKIDGTKIMRSDLIIALQLLPEQYRKMPLQSIYPFVLRQVINNTLIVRAAKSEGLKSSESIRQRLKAIERRLVEAAYLEEASNGKVTSAALRERYRNVTDSLHGKKEYRVRHILVDDDRKAESLIKKLSNGADFAKLALENSTGPSKSKGGDLGYMPREAMLEPFAAAVIALEPGQIAPEPVQTRFGWHVVKLEDQRSVKIPSFEEMRPQLARQIRAKIAIDIVNRLRKGANIVEFDINGKKKPTSASRARRETSR